MKRFLLISTLIWIMALQMGATVWAQSSPSSASPTSQRAGYSAWVTGDTADAKTRPMGGIVLAGGSTDIDSAMRWLLRRSNGGDVVIIRASGSDGYNKYLYSQLGEPVNSVETILVNTRELASHPDIVRKVHQAEAIFFAGGDQANYVNFYRNTPLADAFNERIRAGAVLGGTSAGCAVLGQLYFSAREGSVTSEEALADPFDKRVTLGNSDFLMQPLLAGILTDQHYTARNRQGRHLVFLARALTDWNIRARGIGVDEKTAVCISPDGTARVFGQGNVYFLAPVSVRPDDMQAGKPLNWPGTGQAVRVTVVPGSAMGTIGFDVKTFRGADSLKTVYWSVENGLFKSRPGRPD